MRKTTLAILVALLALLSRTLVASNLPEVASLEDVQLTVVSVARGLLDQGCDYGSHREEISISGTGQAQHTFEIDGCPPERREFDLPTSEVETMISELLELNFHLLAADYEAAQSVCVDCVAGYPSGSLIRLDTVTSHAPDVTVTLRIAEFEHSVHYHHGATVLGLSEWVAQRKPTLWRKAGFLRHFAPEDR